MGTYTGYDVVVAPIPLTGVGGQIYNHHRNGEVASTTNCEDIEMFPEYKDKLYALEKAHRMDFCQNRYELRLE